MINKHDYDHEKYKPCSECRTIFPRDISGSEFCPECRKPLVLEIMKNCNIKHTQWKADCKWRFDCPCE